MSRAEHVTGVSYWGLLGFTVWPLAIAYEHFAGREILMWHVDAMA